MTQDQDQEAWKLATTMGLRGLGPARLAVALLKAKQPMTIQELLNVNPMHTGRVSRCEDTVRVQLSNLRSVLGPHSVVNTYGLGYHLSDAARQRMTDVLESEIC